MTSKITLVVNCLALMFFYHDSVRAEAEPVDDFFAMSPAELAATSVTIATGTAKSVSQSAAVTSVITAEQIKAMGATELHQVLETVPGMHGSLQASTGDYHYSLRGIANATNSEILMLLNGTRYSLPYVGTTLTGMELSLEAIQQIEVIRGPGSALYGADAFAGVINIITKKAKDIDGTTVGGRVGDHDTQSGWGQHGTTWAGWDIATSLQYQHTGGDNSRVLKTDLQTVLDKSRGTNASNAPGSMNTNYESYNGHLNLQRKHWDIGFWAFDQQGGSRAGTAVALDPKGNITGGQYLGDVRFSTADWFNDWELLAHGSYLRADFLAPLQVFPDGTKLPIDQYGNILPKRIVDIVAIPTFQNGVNARVGRVEEIPAFELSSIYKGWANHLLRASAGYRSEIITTSETKNYGPGVLAGAASPTTINGTLTSVTNTPYVYLANMHRSVWSYVLQDEWKLAEDWQLTAGGRYDGYSDFGGTFNPRAALVWDVNKQLTTKWMYGKAFRAPGFAEQAAQNNPVRLGNRNLKPETMQTYEWAFDYHPVSSIRTAANLYYYQIKQLIALVPEIASSTFQNTGTQNGYGAEFEGNWQVNEQWNLMGNYAWQYALNDKTESRVTGVPTQQVYFAAAWQFIPKWYIQPQIKWVGSRINPIVSNGPLNDYQTIDLTLRGKKLYGHLNLAASLRNALDTRYQEPASVAIGGNLPMPGRSFYLEASINF